MTAVHVVVPDSIDDQLRPSGGNVYDRRVCDGLAGIGWTVHEHHSPGSWPSAEPSARSDLTRELADIPDGELVMMDGLIASAAPEIVVPSVRRLRIVVLVHMPLEERFHQGERAVLTSVASIVTTSRWTRERLFQLYALPVGHTHVASPGCERAALAARTPAGGELICVAAVTPTKGHDVLVDALAALDRPLWRCACIGSLEIDSDFVARVRHLALQAGLADRIRFCGPLTGDDLGATYATADLLVLASRAETYAMVVTEALARGVPALVTDVGGVSEAVGVATDGRRPGLLVPAGDPDAIATALRRWLDDPGERERLRNAAESRRTTLSDWAATSRRLSRVLADVAA